MKRNFYTLIIPLLVLACTDDSSPEKKCSVENPTEDLEWLRLEIQSLEQSELSQFSYVSQAEYQNQTVFIFGNCCPNCNTVIPVYTCSGENLGVLGTEPDDIDFSLLENDSIIWQPENFECEL